MKNKNKMHKCLFCNKTYVKPKCLKNHYIKCSVAHNVNLFNCKDELFELMRELVKSNESLSQRVKKLEGLVLKEKKKIDVVNWLNENVEDCITYTRFIEGIEINKEIMNSIYENGIIEGLTQILIEKLDENESKCIYCFEQKSYTLYVKKEETWGILDNNDFQKNIFYLQRKILKKFREENSIDSLQTDRDHNIYNKRLQNICDINMKTKIKNIRNDLYRHIKVNIEKLVSYDFTF
jgi:hypothetical protein